MSETDCVFCKIVKGEIPSEKVYENDFVYAFHDINPVAPTHVLIIPKKHIKNLASVKLIDAKDLGEVQAAVPAVAQKVGVENAFRLLSASGSDAGQSVFHLHYHLIGGWKGKNPKMEAEEGRFP